MAEGGRDEAATAMVAGCQQKQGTKAIVLTLRSNVGGGGATGCVLVIVPAEVGVIAGGSRY